METSDQIPHPQLSSDQMPAPGKIKLIKFPPPGQEKTSNARGMPGGGCWSFDLTDTLLPDFRTLLPILRDRPTEGSVTGK